MSIQESAQKWAEDIRHNWLRYLVELFIICLLVFPVLTFWFSAKIDRLEMKNAHLLEDMESLSARLREEESKSAEPVDAAAQCPPSELSTIEAALERATLERDEARGLAERLRQQRDRCMSEAVPVATSEASATAQPAASTVSDEDTVAYDCNGLQRAMLGLERLQNSFQSSSLGFRERANLVDLAGSHIKELQKIYSQDQVFQSAHRALLFSTGSEASAIQTALFQAQGYAEAFCPDLAARRSESETSDPSVDQHCSSLESVRTSLAQLRQSVDASSALTRKDQFVDIFNGLLSQAKRTLKSDAFVANIDPVYNHTLYVNTKKALLQSIDLLAGRIDHANAECGRPRAETTVKSQDAT